MSADEDAARYRRAKRIFFELMDTPKASWAARVRDSCGGDEALEQEVATLLENREADTDHLAPRIDVPSGTLPSELSDALLGQLAGELNSPSSSDPVARPRAMRFSAGDRFADRYTMEARIGVGGMGEVWRAHDRMLDETVALKFLRSRGKGWVERLLRETAIARRISHRNVCRVHDASQVDGMVFLSMEFVPGLDLDQKLRRDGRFEPEASRKLASELVDALATIHSMGLLHRDLKPANILLDEGGEARVSDFGLAISAETASKEDTHSGTRMYMAPEQLRGEAPSEASDIYALGLVLYEAVTNRRAFRSAEEVLGSAEAGSLPPRPSVLAPHVDAVLDHIILRCLDPELDGRPSARELQEALGLDDPLAAVLSLGDVPTAEVIQGSRSRLPLSPSQARWVLFGAMVTLALIAVARRVHGVHPMPERSPLELADEAQSILTEFLGAAPAAAPFEVYSYAQEVPVYVRSGFRLVDRLSGNPVEHHFWYRTSDEPISPREATSQLFGFGRVRAFDPVPGAPGTTIVVFDRSGSVVFLDARRPPDASTPLAGPVSWERVFQLAGLRFEEFESCAPLPARAAQADRHLAWESSDASLRVESATSGGSVVAFELLEPEAAGEAPSASSDLFILLNTLLIAGLFAIAMPRALRHFRSGRGDPQISVRVALCTTGALLCSWLLYADYPGTAFDRFAFCIAGVFTSFAGGYLIWILSVAVEPSVQRDWPRIFITWSRFFRGHVRGPGVRSDLLTGLALGLFVLLLQALVGAGVNDAVELSPAVRTFHWSIWAGTVFEAVSASVLISLEFVAVLAILGWILRGKRRAVFGTWLIACVLAAGSSEGTGASLVAVLNMSLMLSCLLRYGLLATFALALSMRLLENTPLAPTGGAWYAAYGNATLVLTLVLLVWAAWPLLRSRSTDRSHKNATSAGAPVTG